MSGAHTEDMRLLQGVNVAKLDIRYVNYATIFLKFYQFIRCTFVVEGDFPRQIPRFVTGITTEPDHCIELDTNGHFPSQWLIVEVEPHFLKRVHAVNGHELIVNCLDFVQNESEVVQSWKHDIEWSRNFASRDVCPRQRNLNRQLAVP